MMTAVKKVGCGLAAVLLLATGELLAQWKTETFVVKDGWSAIYPLVDAGDVTLDVLLAGRPEIQEVWRWNPSAIDPLMLGTAPIAGSEWSVWKRGSPADSTMNTLLPNYGYLLKAATSKKADISVSIKGRVVMPEVSWRSDGLNLVGFPSESSPAPTIENYLTPSGLLEFETPVYEYVGEDLKLDGNPVMVLNKNTATMRRGQAYWIGTGRYSDYYGPIKVQVALSPEGLSFGDEGSTRQLILTNRTAETRTVTLTPAASETDRSGGGFDPVPLLERVFDEGSQNFIYPAFDGPRVLTLPPGETMSKLIVLDRAALVGAPGDVNASLLTMSDGGTSRIHIPVTATVSSLAGLWVGEAHLDQVQNQLQKFERDENGDYIYVDGVDGDGNATQVRVPIDGTNVTTLQETAQAFPVRLLVHVDGAGNARLLSTVFAGPLESTGALGLTTAESGLADDGLDEAVRLTSVHYPLDLDLALAGTFGPGGSLGGTVTLLFNDTVSPFVHAYHPDHDNLDARFEAPLGDGAESYTIARDLTIAFDADDSASPDPTWGATTITGTYGEVVTGIHKNTLEVQGPFLLRRLSDIDTLNTP